VALGLGRGYDFTIVGAGPAGVAAAYAISRRGYGVLILEAAERPGLKPCGWAIPDTGDLPVPVPRDTVLARIRGAELLVDGSPAVRVEGWLSGYIVDKPAYLEALASEAGADVEYRSPFIPARRAARLRGSMLVDVKPSLVAGGIPFYAGEKILAVEAPARPRGDCPVRDMLYIDFDTRLIGYFWAFPRGEGELQVGVGGYADYATLRGLLEWWVERRLPCKAEILGGLRGAPLAVGGLSLGESGGAPLAGEAAGFVLPLTGEGIRPSLISGYRAGEALASGSDPLKAQGEAGIARAVRVQRRILERVKRMSPRERGRLLSSIPARVHAEVALGTLRVGVIARELASRPRLASRILRLILGG